MSKKFINGYTRESFLSQLEEKNGWKRCGIFNEVEMEKCLYRDSKNYACAVGAFIPDNAEVLETILDLNWSLESLDKDILEELEQYMPLELEDMKELQQLHDLDNNQWSKQTVENWLDAL